MKVAKIVKSFNNIKKKLIELEWRGKLNKSLIYENQEDTLILNKYKIFLTIKKVV